MVLWNYYLKNILKNKSYLLIINPVSGLRQGSKKINFIINFFKDYNIMLDVFSTAYKGHAKEYISTIDNKKFSNLIIYGGDGTFNEVINGLLSRKDNYLPKIGLLPGGSGNSVMHHLNYLNLKDACISIANNNTIDIDIMQIKYDNHIEYSINMLGWGMVSDIGILAEKLRWLGPIRYNVASLYYIFNKYCRSAKIIIDNICFDDHYLFILVANTQYTGKGMMVAPEAELTDGLLDLILVKDKITRIQLMQLLPKLFTGEHITSPYVQYQKIKSLDIHSEFPDLLNIDGEIYGSTPVNINILDKKLSIYYSRIP